MQIKFNVSPETIKNIKNNNHIIFGGSKMNLSREKTINVPVKQNNKDKENKDNDFEVEM